MRCLAYDSLSDHIDLYALYGFQVKNSLFVGSFSEGGDLFADCCFHCRNQFDFVSSFITEYIELTNHSVLDYNKLVLSACSFADSLDCTYCFSPHCRIQFLNWGNYWCKLFGGGDCSGVVCEYDFLPKLVYSLHGFWPLDYFVYFAIIDNLGLCWDLVENS